MQSDTLEYIINTPVHEPVNDELTRNIMALMGAKSNRYNILYQKLSRKTWGYSGRVRESRYTGEKLREIRKSGQSRECARRRGRILAGK